MKHKQRTVNIRNWGFVEMEWHGGDRYSLNFHNEKCIYKLEINYNWAMRLIVGSLKKILREKRKDLDYTIKCFSRRTDET